MSQYKTTCKKCGCNDFTVWSNGTAKCWQCGYFEKNSDAKYIAPKRSRYIDEIRAYYDEITRYYHSCLDTSHRLWLYSRGISDHSINTLRLGFCPDDIHVSYISRISKIAGLTNKENRPNLAGRIIFPFFAEGLVTDVWGRAIDPTEEIRYKGPAGSPYTRGADYMYMHDAMYKPQAYKRIVHTEGIIKCIIANQYGVSCVAVPGTNVTRNGTVPMVNQQQTICFDSQTNNRFQLISAIKKYAQPYTNPKIATLPLRGESKQDIDSYILRYGIDDFIRIIDNALEYKQWEKLVR